MKAQFAILTALLCQCVWAGETVYDIIPACWITHDGHVASAPPREPILLLPHEATSPVTLQTTIADGFTKESCFKGSKTFKYTAADEDGQFQTLEIQATRPKKSSDLILEISGESQSALLRLSWKQKLRVQEDFYECIISESECGCLRRLLGNSKPTLISEMLRTGLVSFWTRAFNSRAFSQDPVLFAKAPRELPKKVVEDNVAAGMGYYRLVPAMRVKVLFGGTAVYPLGTSALMMSRQTVGGSADFEVHTRNRAPILGVGESADLETIGPFQGRMSNNATSSTGYGLGFGISSDDPEGLKLITAFNPYDLSQAGSPTFPSPVADMKLYALTPFEYTKADFPDKPTPKINWLGTHDAMEVNQSPPTGLQVKSVARHPMFYRSSGDPRPILSKASNTVSAESPLTVFGNQSWLRVEIAISINDAPATWKDVGSTIVDVAATDRPSRLNVNAKALAERPPITLVRNARCFENPAEDEEPKTIEYRFWTTPRRELSKIEVNPGDEIHFAR